jgi:hypothetical protein
VLEFFVVPFAFVVVFGLFFAFVLLELPFLACFLLA